MKRSIVAMLLVLTMILSLATESLVVFSQGGYTSESVNTGFTVSSAVYDPESGSLTVSGSAVGISDGMTVTLRLLEGVSSFSDPENSYASVSAVKTYTFSDIKTIGGVCGFLVEVNNDENTNVIETGTDDKKSYVKFDKAAIYQTGPANPAAPEKKEEAKAEDKKEEKAE